MKIFPRGETTIHIDEGSKPSISYDGRVHRPYTITYPRYRFLVTRWWMRDCAWSIPKKFKKVNYDFDRDIWEYAIWYIAPPMRLWYWWAKHRYILERFFRRKGIFIIQEGDHCKNWKMNWRWPFYNPRHRRNVRHES